MPSEDNIPIEAMPPVGGDIILTSGLRMAVELNRNNETLRILFSRPIYFVSMTRRNVDKLIHELQKHLIDLS